MPEFELALHLCAHGPSYIPDGVDPLYASIHSPITPEQLLMHIASTLDLGDINVDTLKRHLLFYAPGGRSSLCQHQLLERLAAFAAASTEEQQPVFDALISMLRVKDRLDLAAEHQAGEPVGIRLVVQFPQRLMPQGSCPAPHSLPALLPPGFLSNSAQQQRAASLIASLGSQWGGADTHDPLGQSPLSSLGSLISSGSGAFGANLTFLAGLQQQQQQQQPQQQQQQQSINAPTAKKIRQRMAHDKSRGKQWTVEALELADRLIPRVPPGGHLFYQPTTVPKELGDQFEKVLASICKLVTATDSARGANVGGPLVRKHILEHLTAVNADVRRLLAYAPYEKYMEGWSCALRSTRSPNRSTRFSIDLVDLA